MGRGGRAGSEKNYKERARFKDVGSDDSDEDYVLEEEENESDNESEDFGDSSDGYASKESFGRFVEEEEEEQCRKAVRSKKKRSSIEEVKTEGKTSRKRNRVSYEEDGQKDDDEDYVNDDAGNDDDDDDDDGDDEFTPDEEDGDDEFTPDEEDGDDDCLYEDEDLASKPKKNVKVSKRSGSARGRKKRKKSRVQKKPALKKRRTGRRLRKKVSRSDSDGDDVDFVDNSPVGKVKNKRNSVQRRRRYAAACSDSDSASDYGYSISIEEKEQVRETNGLCGQLKSSLRSSSSVTRIDENGDACLENKANGRKGKEKIKDKENGKEIPSEMVKQTCGICLSEEDRRRFRGTLNCCSHFFCFTCIMEWSKVESRCPLCKQRFSTITKTGRSTIGVDLKNSVIDVPERDQVYQPTEEEIRSFVDPYENVICSECHEGGDDELMLLCDLCDSPAHTYCVGLGHQVPDGNWYCDGCRPVALGSLSSQAHETHPDERTASISTLSRLPPIVEGSEPSLEPSPRGVPNLGFGNLPSPRFTTGEVQMASPVSGAGAPTLLNRRQIHRHIQNLISSSRMSFVAGRADGIFSPTNTHVDVFNSQIPQIRDFASLQNPRRREVGTSQQPEFFMERLRTHDHPPSSTQNGEFFSLRPSILRSQAAQDLTASATNTASSVNLTLWPGLAGANPVPLHDQFYQSNSRTGIGSGSNSSPCRAREESDFYVVKEQLQTMVKTHLKSLSQDIELGHDTFKDIARSSTHTILAACGLEHRRSEVQLVPSPCACTHFDKVAAGETSLMKGFCSSCFDSFVKDVVKRIMDTRSPQWLSLGL